MITRRATEADLPGANAVRHEVFVVGQGVPEEIEQDGRDGTAVHVVVLDDDQVVGTARYRDTAHGAKAERVAVLASHRGRGLGALLMGALEDAARDAGHTHMVLHAQAAVIDFYIRLGYVGHGERFHEAGIEHLSMRKALEGSP